MPQSATVSSVGRLHPSPVVSEVRAGLAALRPEMLSRALRLVRSRPQAEDLVQEAFLRALRFEHQFQGGTNLRAWVGQVLMSVFLTRCRSQRRERRALVGLAVDPCAWTQQGGLPMTSALSGPVTSALESLPPSYREAVELVDLDQCSYRDAAARAGVPLGTIMSRLHRGRKLLGERLCADPGALVERGAPVAA